MIKLIVDKISGSHGDLLLNIHSFPVYSKTADSYYLFDFMEISDDELLQFNRDVPKIMSYGAGKFLEYWKSRVQSIKLNESKFIPFDLSDQYILGMLMKKETKFIKTEIVWTPLIEGWSINKSILDKVIIDKKINFEPREKHMWKLSEQSIIKGLDWSIKELD